MGTTTTGSPKKLNGLVLWPIRASMGLRLAWRQYRYRDGRHKNGQTVIKTSCVARLIVPRPYPPAIAVIFPPRGLQRVPL